MKKRLSVVANFFAFNLLFFALYLNFIKKDNNNAVSVYRETPTAYVKETVLLQGAAPFDSRQASAKEKVRHDQKENSPAAPLRLSFN